MEPRNLGDEISGDAAPPPWRLAVARVVWLQRRLAILTAAHTGAKRAERALKTFASAGRAGGGGVSAVPPPDYAARFRAFLRRVFV